MALRGSTVWLIGSFTNKAGVLTDPVSVSLEIFNSSMQPIFTDENVDYETYRQGNGVLHYPYTLPDDSKVYFKFTGDVEGFPEICTAEVPIETI